MPKYYCDYCDIYLTHDSIRVRRDHNRGWKHGLQVKAYFTELNQERLNSVIDEILKDYETKGEYVPIYTAPAVPPPGMPGMPGMPFVPGMMRPPFMSGVPMMPPGGMQMQMQRFRPY